MSTSRMILNVSPSVHGEINDHMDQFNQEDWHFCLEDLDEKQLQMAFNAICKIAEIQKIDIVAEE